MKGLGVGALAGAGAGMAFAHYKGLPEKALRAAGVVGAAGAYVGAMGGAIHGVRKGAKEKVYDLHKQYGSKK